MELWRGGEGRGGGGDAVLCFPASCTLSKPWLVFLPPKYVFSSYWSCHCHNEVPALIPNNLLYYNLYANCIRFLMPKHERRFSQQMRWLPVLKSWRWFPWRNLTRTLRLTLSVPALWWLRFGPREVVPWPQSWAESEGGGMGRGGSRPWLLGGGRVLVAPASRVQCQLTPSIHGICLRDGF